MATAPMIKTPLSDGGTFYTFSSAARDLTLTRNQGNLELVFSKFALLNIPNFDRLNVNTFSNFQNYMQFNTIDGAIFDGSLKPDPNVNLTESLQNYAFNLERLILSSPNYDSSSKKSSAERIFFKWLKETGAIRFRDANTLERVSSPSLPAYVEEDTKTSGSVIYNRVVKYLGEIDMINNVDKAGEAYTEIYINVPTEVGNTPTVLFNSIQDTNYREGLIIRGRSEFIEGRNSSTIHPQNLSINAYYDYDDSLLGGNSGGYSNSLANWMNESTPAINLNSYFTEPVFGDSSNIDITKTPSDYGSPANFAGVAYRRSKLDGISVNFNPSDYRQITSNNSINTISQLNGTDLSGNFEFNAVLLYYDLIDSDNPGNIVTNLYGVLFLDNVTPTINGGFIQRFPKFKPNKLTGQNGNSYGFRINLKIDAQPGTTGVSTIINDYNTFSMQLFSEATAQLQESVRIFQRQQSKITQIETQFNEVRQFISTLPESLNIQSRLTQIEKSLTTASNDVNYNKVIDLISKLSDQVTQLVNGRLPVTLQYNTDVLKPLPGFTLDKSVPNVIKIGQTTQRYAFMIPTDHNDLVIDIDNPLNLNLSNGLIQTDLRNFSNMLRIRTVNESVSNLKIIVDDSTNKFKTGQSIKIVFENDLNLGSFNLNVYTDSLGRINTIPNTYIISSIQGSSLSKRPIIEIICTNADTMTFVTDIIK